MHVTFDLHTFTDCKEGAKQMSWHRFLAKALKQNNLYDSNRPLSKVRQGKARASREGGSCLNSKQQYTTLHGNQAYFSKQLEVKLKVTSFQTWKTKYPGSDVDTQKGMAYLTITVDQCGMVHCAMHNHEKSTKKLF